MSGAFRTAAAPCPPGPRRALLAAMVVLQAALFGGLSRTLILPGLVGAAAALAVRPRARGRLSRVQLILAAGLTGAGCLAFWRVFPHRRPVADIDPALSAFGHALGQWALLWQTLTLYLDWGADAAGRPRMPAAAPAAGVVVLLAAGDVKASEFERAAFLLAAVAFALLCGLYFAAGGSAAPRRAGAAGARAGRWPRRAVLVAVAASVAGLSWGSSATLRRYERTMDRVIRRFLRPEPLGVSAGFSGETRLGDVRQRKTYGGEEVALRVYRPSGAAAGAPGYLRGRAFYTLEVGDGVSGNLTKWVGGEEETRRLNAAGVPPATALRVRRGDPTDATETAFAFDFSRPAAAEAAGASADDPDRFAAWEAGPRAVEVWPAAGFKGAVFVPPRTARLLAPQPVIDADEYGLTIATPFGLPHYVADPAPGRRATDWRALAVSVDPADPRCGAVPPVVAGDAGIAALADRLFAGANTTAGRIAAVETYFRRTHEYELGARLGSTGNPLREFLLRKVAAHCEYFATAATILLRTRGVRTRYVTGFVAAEYNPIGGYWAARNADAHAWCEAWDPSRGWTVVEATPAAGVPGPRGGEFFGQVWDAAAAKLARVRQGYAERGGWWALLALARWLLTGPGTVLAAACFPVLAWAGWRRWRASRRGDPARRAARGELRRLDRRLRRRGLVRAPAEPLHDFAAMVAAGAGEPDLAARYGELADSLYRPIP